MSRDPIIRKGEGYGWQCSGAHEMVDGRECRLSKEDMHGTRIGKGGGRDYRAQQGRV